MSSGVAYDTTGRPSICRGGVLGIKNGDCHLKMFGPKTGVERLVPSQWNQFGAVGLLCLSSKCLAKF